MLQLENVHALGTSGTLLSTVAAVLYRWSIEVQHRYDIEFQRILST